MRFKMYINYFVIDVQVEQLNNQTVIDEPAAGLVKTFPRPSQRVSA